MNHSRSPRLLIILLALAIAGCSAVGSGGGAPSSTTSVETLEYYPYQVKGYQNSYPRRSIAILIPTDALDRSGPNAAPLGDQPAVGIVTDQLDNVTSRLFSPPLPGIVQNAIGHSAEEAGLQATALNQSNYDSDAKLNADYVLAPQLTKCWVKKHRGPDGMHGSTWTTQAEFAMLIVVYKPPFKIPFWEGTSSQTYFDPPVGSFGLGPDDEAGIYDRPGQVLSVAMTRAVAGIFENDSLRTLIQTDRMTSH